jgi:hypothetical protein
MAWGATGISSCVSFNIAASHQYVLESVIPGRFDHETFPRRRAVRDLSVLSRRTPSDGAWDVAVRGTERLARTLDERWLEALLYRDLSILRTDVPIPHTFTDLEWRGAKRENLLQFCDSLGESDVIDQVPLFR